MSKTVLLAAAAALALCAGGASAATSHPGLNSHGFAKKFAHAPVNRALHVLYDQNGTDSGIGIVSQNFESSFDAYDAQAADDFTVPDGGWKVKEVDVTGVYFNGPGLANSENVVFYKDKKGRPGKIVASFDVTGVDDGFGSFVMALPKTVRLKPGHYWMSVQANMDFAVGGEWGWENQVETAGSSAMWKNAGDGFATGCTKWSVENTCIADGQGDHMFTLRGRQ